MRIVSSFHLNYCIILHNSNKTKREKIQNYIKRNFKILLCFWMILMDLLTTIKML